MAGLFDENGMLVVRQEFSSDNEGDKKAPREKAEKQRKLTVGELHYKKLLIYLGDFETGNKLYVTDIVKALRFSVKYNLGRADKEGIIEYHPSGKPPQKSYIVIK